MSQEQSVRVDLLSRATWRWVGARFSPHYDIDSYWEGLMSRNLFCLNDEQSARSEPHLPTDVRGVERGDDPRVIRGMCTCSVVRLPGSS